MHESLCTLTHPVSAVAGTGPNLLTVNKDGTQPPHQTAGDSRPRMWSLHLTPTPRMVPDLGRRSWHIRKY